MRVACKFRLTPAAPGLALALALGLAQPAQSLDLIFPGSSKITASRATPAGSVRLPVGPFAKGALPTELVEGALDMTAHQITLDRASTLDLIQSLRAQILSVGFDVVFECETEACGGYDFRYGAEVLPEPDMHVDLGDFRYLLARDDGPAKAVVALLVSRSGQTGFVQVTRVGGLAAGTASGTAPPSAPIEAHVATAPETVPAPSAPGLVAGLEAGLPQVLDDLIFPSGSSALAAGAYPSLATLAAWMQADPGRKVVLVGHTDASGGLEGNIRLSRLRAESVRQALISSHKISPDRVRAEGIGFLSPRASNLTEDGRRQNRRVEVMATSTGLTAP